MSRQTRGATKKFLVLLLMAVMTLSGCHPTQPFYLFEKGDLQHYIDTATEIEYPDVDQAALSEAAGAREPLTLLNPHFDEFWNLTLEEAMHIALKNSTVIRTLGLQPECSGRVVTSQVCPNTLTRGVGDSKTTTFNINTVYNSTLIESNPGSIGLGTGPDNILGTRSHGNGPPGQIGFGDAGPEAALAAFDARVSAGSSWQRTDQAQNFSFFASQSDSIRNHIQVSKRSSTGGEFFIRTNADYQQSNQTGRNLPSDWQANIEMEARHHILRGAGTQINRAKVVIGRLNTDVSLVEFEKDTCTLVGEVERAYGDLINEYHKLESRKAARDSALVSWKKVKTKEIVGVPGGEAEKEAQARQQYFSFRSQLETALRELFTTEQHLRYLMGLTPTDGRLIRPIDEPVTAKVAFDWCQILSEALTRSPHLRQQKWRVKHREMELIVARNGLLPRLDVVGLYRWLGTGDDLIEAERQGSNFPTAGSLAWDELTEGKYQAFSFGVVGEFPIGFRQESAGVRYSQLNLARSQAVLEEMELEVSHMLSDAYQDMEASYLLMQTNYNWRVSAQKEVDAVGAAYETGTQTLDLLLRAQQSRADAETQYYETLRQYNAAIVAVHYIKGSLLEYNNICLAEGAWPCKAYHDAMAHARRRDASHYLNYGFTRPGVISRGEYQQFQNGTAAPGHFDPEALDAPVRIEEVAPGVETLEVPPMPEPHEGDSGGFFRREPAETATRPIGPELAPPVLRPASGTSDEATPIGAGLKVSAGQDYDWGILESRLPADTNVAQLAPVVPASHEAPGRSAVTMAVPQPAATPSVKPQPPQPTPAASPSWRATSR